MPIRSEIMNGPNGFRSEASTRTSSASPSTASRSATSATALDLGRVGGHRSCARGRNPDAAFYVNLRPEATSSGSIADPGPLTRPSRVKGMHGYFPATPNLSATFMLMGSGVPAGKPLGQIDMRSIAPTLGSVLGVALPAAELPAIPLESGR